MSVEPDASRLPKDWAEALFDTALKQGEFDSLVDGAYGNGSSEPVFPKRSDVFRAFHKTPLKSVRVVILGKDPYPTKGDAHGLAFSYLGDPPFPRSLKVIFQNLADDPEIRMRQPLSGDLTPWTRHGVLLLNTALTFKTGQGSHLQRWQRFTDLVLRAVNEECDRVAFLAWGKPAINKVKAIAIDPKHTMIRTAHPAVWARSNERRFNACHPFTEANAFLGNDPIDWRLPTEAH